MRKFVEGAERALRTNQPRLAELYMRRALQETAGGRSYLAGLELVEAGRLFMRTVCGAVNAVAEAFRPLFGLFDDVNNTTQKDYTLI